MLVTFSVWIPRLDKCMGYPSSGRPPDSSRAVSVTFCKCNGDVPRFMPSISAPILEPVCVLVSDFGIGSPWAESLSYV